MNAEQVAKEILSATTKLTTTKRKAELAMSKFQDAVLDGDEKRAEEARLEYITLIELGLDAYRETLLIAKKNNVPI